MKKTIFFIILISIISFNSYCQSVSNKALDFSNKISNSYDETLSMIQVLQEFNSSGDPLNNYSWNRKLSDLYYSQIELVPRNEKVKYWIKYCTQLLPTGDNQ